MDGILHSKPTFSTHGVNALCLELDRHISMWHLGVLEQFIIGLKPDASRERLTSYSLIKNVLLVCSNTRGISSNQLLDVLLGYYWHLLSRL